VKILILQGPNLNLLGHREPEIYGSMTLSELHTELEEYAKEISTQLPKGAGRRGRAQLRFFQSSYEGELIDELHRVGYYQKDWLGVVFNPAAYTRYSYALRDAIAAVDIPVVEVHLSDIEKREDFRQVSVVRDVCAAHFSGKGIQSYKDGIDFLINQVKG
jgi:3-dehydroquinate dehydratase-2